MRYFNQKLNVYVQWGCSYCRCHFPLLSQRYEVFSWCHVSHCIHNVTLTQINFCAFLCFIDLVLYIMNKIRAARKPHKEEVATSIPCNVVLIGWINYLPVKVLVECRRWHHVMFDKKKKIATLNWWTYTYFWLELQQWSVWLLRGCDCYYWVCIDWFIEVWFITHWFLIQQELSVSFSFNWQAWPTNVKSDFLHEYLYHRTAWQFI